MDLGVHLIKKGLKNKKKKSQLKMTIKPPLDIDYSKTVEEIMDQVMYAIEQSPEHDTLEQIKKQTAVSE